MKPGLWAFLVIFLGIASSIEAAAQGSPEPVQRTLTVGCELDYPPFSLTKPDQSPDGFTVDLWNAVAREAGLKFDIRVAPFHEILDGFKQGRIDVMINLAISEPRKEFANFSVPHVTMYGAIFVRKGDGRIRTDADLAGKALIVLNKDLAHDYALARGWTNLALVDDTASGLRLLAQGSHDAMLVGKLVGLNALQELKITNIRPVDHRLEFFQKFAFCVKRGVQGNTELLARINEGLALVKASGTYDILYEKWFGVLEPRKISLTQILKYLIPTLALLVLTSLAYAFERRLRLNLKQTVSTLNATLESTADGILVVDQAGNITTYNRNFLELWQLQETESEIRALSHDEIVRRISPWFEDPATFIARAKTVASEPGLQSFDLLQLKDGRAFERISKPQMIDGHSSGRVWCFRDVTEREKAAVQARRFNQELEQRVQERTLQLEIAGRDLERLSYVASRTSNAVIITDPKGRIEWVNAGFEKLTGWSAVDVQGRKPGSFLQGPDTDAATVQHIRDSILAQRPVHFELLNYHRDGHAYWIEAEICPVFSKQGELINFIAIESDITGRRNSERELKRQRQELSELNTHLQKAIRSRDEFLAAMSHELRTPLNGVLTLSGLLSEEEGSNLNERQIAYASQIHASGQQLLELINDILDYVKIESGSLVLEPAELELEYLCQSCVRGIRPAALKKRQVVSCIVTPPDLKVRVDRRRMNQVLTNLLGNAVKFTGEGGNISLAAEACEEGVRITVSDDGIGIDPERISQLFQPFVQLDSGLTRKYNGTGLGLALVRRLVELHRGRVEVSSEPGRGSRFMVMLPTA